MLKCFKYSTEDFYLLIIIIIIIGIAREQSKVSHYDNSHSALSHLFQNVFK